MTNSKPKTYAAKIHGKDVRVTVPKNPTPTEVFDDAIRDALSPEAVVAIAAHIRAASCKHAKTNKEMQWFADHLMNLVGIENYNRIIEEIGL